MDLSKIGGVTEKKKKEKKEDLAASRLSST